MVIGISPDLLEVVVLPAHPDTLLGVRRPAVLTGPGAKKDILELVHPCISKQQGGITVWNDRGARDDAVPALFEEREKTAADLV
jgi:hypothetical protein